MSEPRDELREVARAMDEAALAMEEFARTMEEIIDKSVAALLPHGHSAVRVSWTEERNGDISLGVELDNGDVISGRGGGKLDAIAAAERALG